MKIIAKYKDYYDYLQGVYGIDPLATYDRRDSEYIDLVWDKSGPFETPEEMTARLSPRKDIRKGLVYDIQVSVIVGDTLYTLGIEPTGKMVPKKYGYGGEGMQMRFVLLDKETVDRKGDTTPVLYIKGGAGRTWKRWNKWGDYKSIPTWNKDNEMKNPNFSKTNFGSIVPAEEMFLKIQDFILANNEKPIIDSRTDVQKLESAGFDKKTSFRNM